MKNEEWYQVVDSATGTALFVGLGGGSIKEFGEAYPNEELADAAAASVTPRHGDVAVVKHTTEVVKYFTREINVIVTDKAPAAKVDPTVELGEVA
jgi:hypothetical protein